MCWQVAKLLQTLISGSVSCVVPTNEYVKDELKPACWTFVIVSLVFWRRDSRTWQPKGGSTAEQLRKAAEVAAAAGSDAVNASEVWSFAPYLSWKHRERGKEQPKGWCFLARLAYYQHLICMEITCIAVVQSNLRNAFGHLLQRNSASWFNLWYTFEASQTVDLHRFVRAIDFFALGQGLETESLQAQSVAEMLDLNLGSYERLCWDTVPPLRASDFSDVYCLQFTGFKEVRCSADFTPTTFW